MTNSKIKPTELIQSDPHYSDEANTPLRPRAALYARVSTPGQLDTEGGLDSLEVQEAILRKYCDVKGFEVVSFDKDIQSSKNLNRPGIERIRSLVRTKSVEVVCAITHDRIAGADDFGAFRSELKRFGVSLRLVEEVVDTDTPEGEFAGRCMVAAKEHIRQNTGTKVKWTFGIWADKEMYPNGKPPFGFLKNPKTHTLYHDPELSHVVLRMFEVYTETRSDFAVRDWLRAQGIPSPKGKKVWTVGTISSLLQNERYIGRIEKKRRNKNRPVVVPDDIYSVRKATTFEPVVPVELFNLARSVRAEQAGKNPRPAQPRVRPIQQMTSQDLLNGDLRGPTNNSSKGKSGHVFLLQGLLFCPVCGHPMSPDYTEKKPNPKEKRKTHSFVNYYSCSLLRKNPDQSASLKTDDAQCGRVLASRVEKWAIGQIAAQSRDIQMIQAVREVLKSTVNENLAPMQEALAKTQVRSREIKDEQGKLVDALLDGSLNEAVVKVLNQKVGDLEQEKMLVIAEQERLREELERGRFTSYDETLFRVLDEFARYARYAKPEELQQILRLFIRRLTCDASGVFRIEFYRLHLPEEQYPGLLQRTENGDLEWKNVGCRIPWEFYRFKNRILKEGVQTHGKLQRRSESIVLSETAQ